MILQRGDYSEQREGGKVLLVPITSNRGLCGGFNSNIIKTTKNLIEKHNNADILSIGKKSTEYFSKNGQNLISSHDELFSELTFENSSKIAESLISMFLSKKYDKIKIIYNGLKMQQHSWL